MKRREENKDLYFKIEIIREILNKKIEEQAESEVILHISEVLDMLIVEYLSK